MGDPRSYHWENGIQVSSVTFKFFSTIAELLCPFFFSLLSYVLSMIGSGETSQQPEELLNLMTIAPLLYLQ